MNADREAALENLVAHAVAHALPRTSASYVRAYTSVLINFPELRIPR
jgi:hypothetical protein